MQEGLAMNTAHPDRFVRLPARRLLEIAHGTPARIECREGSVWITLDHDPRDIVLAPGDSFEHDGARRALVYAFEQSTLEVCQAQPLPAQAYPRGQRPRTTAQVAV
jgi:hypothetical protein